MIFEILRIALVHVAADYRAWYCNFNYLMIDLIIDNNLDQNIKKVH